VNADDLDLIEAALGPSDDGAMNTLWVRFDGAGSADRVANLVGLTATSAPADPSQWGEMQVSAIDMARLWQHVLTAMELSDRSFLVEAMSAAPARARDGFAQDFGLLADTPDGNGPLGPTAKQGWMCCHAGLSHLHSAGLVDTADELVVVLLTRQPRGTGWDTARDEVTRIATAAATAAA
jgi:hypothetical protein